MRENLLSIAAKVENASCILIALAEILETFQITSDISDSDTVSGAISGVKDLLQSINLEIIELSKQVPIPSENQS